MKEKQMKKTIKLYHRAINGEHTFYNEKPDDDKNVITYVEEIAYTKLVKSLKEIMKMSPHDSSIIAHDTLKELGEIE